MSIKLLLSASLISASLFATAQNARTYAITGKDKNNFLWADIKQVDIATGKIVKTLFEADKTPFKATSIDNSANLSRVATTQNPTVYGVAACALDTKHNRLYFAPMHVSDILYLDLNQTDANFTTIKKNVVALPAGNTVFQPEETQISRMVIAADGYGYAITNDGNHVIRFTTDKKPVVEDLGNLVDAESNKVSIHNKCTSWGGDIVADAFGKLVAISASHNIFSIDAKTRIATHTGTITGLPDNYTTNGAVVDNDGNMIVSSANVMDALYKVNMKDLKAVRVESTEKPFNASDLANGNFLNQKEANASVKFDMTKSVLPELMAVGETRVYPNPVTGSEFKVLFDGQKAGNYTIVLTDLAGRSLQSKVVNVTKSNQVETVRIVRKIAKGMYTVKVISDSKQIAFSDRIVVQ